MMSGPFPAFLLMPMALTLRRGFYVSIAGWRFAAVAAVFRQLVLEGLDPIRQLLYSLQHAAEDSHDSFFALAIGRPYFFFCRQV